MYAKAAYNNITTLCARALYARRASCFCFLRTHARRARAHCGVCLCARFAGARALRALHRIVCLSTIPIIIFSLRCLSNSAHQHCALLLAPAWHARARGARHVTARLIFLIYISNNKSKIHVRHAFLPAISCFHFCIFFLAVALFARARGEEAEISYLLPSLVLSGGGHAWWCGVVLTCMLKNSWHSWHGL